MSNNTPARHLVACCTATCIAEVVTLPICTVKTNYQVQRASLLVAAPTSAMPLAPVASRTPAAAAVTIGSTVRHIYQQTGVRGFFRASVPAVVLQSTSTAGKYTVYMWLKNNTASPTTPITSMACGLASGLSVSLLTHPFDFFKIHMQLGPGEALRAIRVHGPWVVYRGYSKNFAKVAIGSTVFFPLYDWLRTREWDSWLAAGTASVVGLTLTQPVDYAKTVHVAGRPWWMAAVRSPGETWRGVARRFYCGFSLNLARTVPHAVICLVLTEQFKNLQLFLPSPFPSSGRTP